MSTTPAPVSGPPTLSPLEAYRKACAEALVIYRASQAQLDAQARAARKQARADAQTQAKAAAAAQAKADAEQAMRDSCARLNSLQT